MQADNLDRVQFPALIGDIGGTNARFALIAAADAPVVHLPTVHTANHATIDDAIRATVLADGALRPKTAILALAGPIAGEEVPLTNCDWVVVPRRLISALGFAEVILLNDFEALSLCLPGLGPGDVEQIGGGAMAPDRARVVVGPGTGLGAAALVHSRGSWIPIPGEGGHIDLAPMTDADMALWPHLEHQDGRIAGETILCGSGMMRLYRGICARDGVATVHGSPAEVTAAATDGSDPRAAETVALFTVYLGRLAGNLALVFSAYGGVYLAGGITEKIAPALRRGAFREAFDNKYPHRRMMERMATAIITRPYAALAGIADFARAPERFGVEMGSRWWRG
ncbi:MAG TPA: glucokinase [Bauldia sp.]|nr:glucokinase [Bauldia sp.]